MHLCSGSNKRQKIEESFVLREKRAKKKKTMNKSKFKWKAGRIRCTLFWFILTYQNKGAYVVSNVTKL